MIAIAETLGSRGWGFPLLHDITDCLRVGDISFIKTGHAIRTVEVKTRLIDKEPTADGRTLLNYWISVVFPLDERKSAATFV
jgi:hypothetical protein